VTRNHSNSIILTKLPDMCNSLKFLKLKWPLNRDIVMRLVKFRTDPDNDNWFIPNESHNSKSKKQTLFLFQLNSPFRERDEKKLNVCLQCIHGNALAMQTPLGRHYDAIITAIIYGLTQTCIMMALTTQCDTSWDIRQIVKRIDTTVRGYFYIYLVQICHEHV
jgi:hypothetical protein